MAYFVLNSVLHCATLWDRVVLNCVTLCHHVAYFALNCVTLCYLVAYFVLNCVTLCHLVGHFVLDRVLHCATLWDILYWTVCYTVFAGLGSRAELYFETLC